MEHLFVSYTHNLYWHVKKKGWKIRILFPHYLIYTIEFHQIFNFCFAFWEWEDMPNTWTTFTAVLNCINRVSYERRLGNLWELQMTPELITTWNTVEMYRLRLRSNYEMYKLLLYNILSKPLNLCLRVPRLRGYQASIAKSRTLFSTE